MVSRYVSNDRHCLPELGEGGGAILRWKMHSKIEHKGMGTCPSIEISQDADVPDQKVKWFLKVRKAYKLLWEAYFSLSFFPSFIHALI